MFKMSPALSYIYSLLWPLAPCCLCEAWFQAFMVDSFSPLGWSPSTKFRWIPLFPNWPPDESSWSMAWGMALHYPKTFNVLPAQLSPSSGTKICQVAPTDLSNWTPIFLVNCLRLWSQQTFHFCVGRYLILWYLSTLRSRTQRPGKGLLKPFALKKNDDSLCSLHMNDHLRASMT